MSADQPKLTTRQRRFAEEYAGDPNAVQAYLRAYGPTTSRGKKRSYHGASKAAARLLQIDAIKAEIAAANAALSARTRASKARVIREIAAVAFVDPADAFDRDPNGGPLVARKLHDIPPATRRAIASVKVKRRRIAGNRDEVYEVEEVEYKFVSKSDALDKLCKRLGLYETDETGQANAVRTTLEVPDNGRDQ